MSTSLIVEDEPTGCPHTTGLAILSWFSFGFGWVGWEISACRTTSEPISLFQSCFKEIVGGSRGDMYTFVFDFLQSEQLSGYNNLGMFREDWRWIASDRTSILLVTKIDVDPIDGVLMFLPCSMHVLCKTRCSKSIVSRSLCSCPYDPQEKECLFVAQIVSSRNMGCKLVALTWQMHLKKPSGMNTLSCSARSIRSSPECPWRARR